MNLSRLHTSLTAAGLHEGLLDEINDFISFYPQTNLITVPQPVTSVAPPMTPVTSPAATPPITASREKPIGKLIDIEGNEKIIPSPDYKNWAAIYNLKTMAESFNFVQTYGGIDEFDNYFKDCVGDKRNTSLRQIGLSTSEYA